MADYRSLVPGGYFSDPSKIRPLDLETNKPLAASKFWNNPGAINGLDGDLNKVAWVWAHPGFVNVVNLDGKNRMAIFETPEHGIAAWLELMRIYRKNGKKTVQEIIWRYGGGQSNYATTYLNDVVARTGLASTSEIKLDGSDDEALLKFAKAMFRHESGGKTIPWSDAQIKHGFALARKQKPVAPMVAGLSVVAGGATVGVAKWLEADATTVAIFGVSVLFVVAVLAAYFLKGRT